MATMPERAKRGSSRIHSIKLDPGKSGSRWSMMAVQGKQAAFEQVDRFSHRADRVYLIALFDEDLCEVWGFAARSARRSHR